MAERNAGVDVSQDQPLAGAAAAPYRRHLARSPIADWIDLMEAVEALCPRWPKPDHEVGYDYRL